MLHRECIEDLFKTSKKVDHFAVRPQYHWTDDKIWYTSFSASRDHDRRGTSKTGWQMKVLPIQRRQCWTSCAKSTTDGF